MWSLGKIWQQKKWKNCLLATLVAHNLKLFSDTPTVLALGRIGTQSYPVSWTELKGQSGMMGCVLFFLKLHSLSTSVEPWCPHPFPHPFTHKPSRLYVNHPWFMTTMKWRPCMKKGCAKTLRASSPAMAFLWIAHFSQEPTMWWEATSTPCVSEVRFNQHLVKDEDFHSFQSLIHRNKDAELCFFWDPYLNFWSQGACKNCTLECK